MSVGSSNKGEKKVKKILTQSSNKFAEKKENTASSEQLGRLKPKHFGHDHGNEYRFTQPYQVAVFLHFSILRDPRFKFPGTVLKYIVN